MSEEWKDDGFFIQVKARDIVSGECYWRRAELGDCRIIISSQREAASAMLEALKEVVNVADYTGDPDTALERINRIARSAIAAATRRET